MMTLLLFVLYALIAGILVLLIFAPLRLWYFRRKAGVTAKAALQFTESEARWRKRWQRWQYMTGAEVVKEVEEETAPLMKRLEEMRQDAEQQATKQTTRQNGTSSSGST